MAGIDSLLKMLIANGANELRVGQDAVPKMLKQGTPLTLSMPATDEATLRHLLDGILTPERNEQLSAQGRVECTHALASGESFSVSIQLREGARGGAFDCTFRREEARRVETRREEAPKRTASPPAPTGVTALHRLLARAASLKASDVHLCAGEPPSLRIDGRLRSVGDLPDDLADQALAELTTPTRTVENSPSRSIDRALEIEGVGKFRVNLYRSSGRLAAAVRLLPATTPTLAQLGLPPSLIELAEAPHGLVLVCGPTGAGKSATLAALVEEALKRRGGMLITLEDPIEYSIAAPPSALVRQRQIGSDVPDFVTGLRDALREDPDILLIGEMRDAESIGLALTAAETGHLVFASMHSRSSASTIERIVDAYPPARQQQIRVQLADSLRGVICQRLLPRRGGGRVPAIELMRGNHNVASLIREGKTAQLSSAVQSSRKEGMLPLERCLADLLRGGVVDREAALAAANDPSALTAYLQG
jgi:twitching motility protein PilT